MGKLTDIISGLSLPEDRKKYYLDKISAEGEAPSILEELMQEHHKFVEEQMIEMGIIDPESEEYKAQQKELHDGLAQKIEEMNAVFAEVDRDLTEIDNLDSQQSDGEEASKIMGDLKAE